MMICVSTPPIPKIAGSGQLRGGASIFKAVRLLLVAAGGLLLPFLLSCSGAVRISQTECDAPPDVEAALTSLETLQEDCGSRLPCYRERVEEGRALRDRFPKSLAAHRLLAGLATQIPKHLTKDLPLRDEFQKQYAELSKRRPKDPVYPYLLALLLGNPASVHPARGKTERRKLLAQAVELDGHFAWAHYALARDLTSYRPSNKEKAEARRLFEAFAAACPARTSEILALLAGLEEQAPWGAHSSRLAAAVTPQSGRFRDLPRFWELQFKFTPPEQHAALRDGLRKDVESLRKLDRQTNESWLRAVREGYRLLGDESGERWAEDQWIAAFPCANETGRLRLARSEKEHPRPSGKNDAEMQAWLSQQFAGSEAWRKSCPDDGLLWRVRLGHLSEWRGATPEMVEEAGQRVLQLIGEPGGAMVADAYIEKGIRLEEAEKLAQAESRRREEDWKEAESGLQGEELKSARDARRWSLFYDRSRQVRLALARKDGARAGKALEDLDAFFSAWLTDASPFEKKYLRADYLGLRAQNAELLGRHDQALKDYRESLVNYPEEGEVREGARRAFQRVRGGERGFTAWLASAEAEAEKASGEAGGQSRKELPDFVLTDLKGRQWKPSDLRGKAVLVNFWATWCGPCRSELPWVQKLHEKLDGDGARMVLTVSVDESTGLIEPFVQKQKYGFPVLVGGPGSKTAFAPNGIPQNWIVGPDGRIVQEHLGFSGDGEKWVSRMESSLKEARARRTGSSRKPS
jgi:cytochrome c biogenesis protein CcmG/thiol:disulfide interchange protein DsbE